MYRGRLSFLLNIYLGVEFLGLKISTSRVAESPDESLPTSKVVKVTFHVTLYCIGLIQRKIKIKHLVKQITHTQKANTEHEVGKTC